MKRNAGFWLTLAGVLASGLVAIGIAANFREPYQHIVSELGAAMMVAALLGATIDFFLKQAITKDAVEAALGYVLPPVLREELKWIYDQKILCTQHHTRFTIRKLDDQLVMLAVRYDRTIKNISGDPYIFDFPLAVDDWGYIEHPSRIQLLGYQVEDSEPVEFKETDLKVRKSPHEICIDDLPSVTLAKEQRITVWAEYSETCRFNDHHVLVFRTPTQDPHVEVIVDEEVDVLAEFGHRGKFSTTRLGRHAWQLHGLLLPNQFIRIVWWPKRPT